MLPINPKLKYTLLGFILGCFLTYLLPFVIPDEAYRTTEDLRLAHNIYIPKNTIIQRIDAYNQGSFSGFALYINVNDSYIKKMKKYKIWGRSIYPYWIYDEFYGDSLKVDPYRDILRDKSKN